EAYRRKELHNLCWSWNVSSLRSISNVVRQSLAFNVIHHHIGKRAFLLRRGDLKVMDLHNVGMVQRGDKLRLAFETCNKIGILFQIGMQQLDRNVSLELCIECLPDFCHATLSQSLLEFIFAEALWMCTHAFLSSWPINRDLQNL